MRHVWTICNLFCFVLTERAKITEATKDGTVCGFLDSLKREEFNIEDKQCLEATEEMLNGVNNSTLWATWIWDTMQRPTGLLHGSRYQLGSFDQCLKPPWLSSHPHLRTQYCLADVYLTDATPKETHKCTLDPNNPTETYVQRKSVFGTKFNLIRWGVCFSSQCSPASISKLVHAMARTQHLPQAAAKEIKVHSCQISGEINQYGSGYIVFLLVVLTFTLLMLISNIYLLYVQSDSLLSQLAKSFCLRRNWNSLTKISEDNIGVLDGMRFMSAAVIVGLHYTIKSIDLVMNKLEFDTNSERIFESLLVHVDLFIDTFLVMSGLLLAKGIVKNQVCNVRGLLRTLSVRYVRFMGLEAIIVLYIACVFYQAGSGPVWPLLSHKEEVYCSNNWWTNVLLINNYVNTSEMCYVVSWYNSCDYQLAVLVVVFYYIYQRNRRVGWTFIAVTFLLSLLLPGLTTYWNSLPVLPAFDMEYMKDVRKNPVFLGVYIQSHNRAGAYLIGMALGHLMALYNPVNYRNVIPKKWAVPGALLALVVMERLLVVGANMVRKEYIPLEVAIFAAVNRVLWSMCICCIIVLCEYGRVPVIGDILKMQLVAPLGRLTYGVYLTHMVLIYHIVRSTRSTPAYGIFHWLVTSLGVLTFSLIISCFTWHLIEAPISNIFNVVLNIMFKDESTGSKKTNKVEIILNTSNKLKHNEPAKNE